MKDCLMAELIYRTSRSSGPGGQHVNKTESRVELIWKPGDSACLNESQKARIILKLSGRLTGSGELILASERYRSQYRNREDVRERFLSMVATALIPPKKRHATRPTHSSQERRIKQKKMRGEIKKSRRDRPSES